MGAFPPIPLPTPLLPTGACLIWIFVMRTCGCFLVFCKNSSSGEGWFLSLYLTCSKHPADVIKRRGKALVDNIRCPRYLNLFFLNAARFSNKPNVIRCVSTPDSSNSLPNHHTHPYRPKATTRSHRENTECRCGKSGAKMQMVNR